MLPAPPGRGGAGGTARRGLASDPNGSMRRTITTRAGVIPAFPVATYAPIDLERPVTISTRIPYPTAPRSVVTAPPAAPPAPRAPAEPAAVTTSGVAGKADVPTATGRGADRGRGCSGSVTSNTPLF